MARKKGGGNTSEMVQLLRELHTIEKSYKSDLAANPNAKEHKNPPKSTFNTPRRVSTEQDDQVFKAWYDNNTLIQPDWNPYTLYQIIQESDVLGACLRCYRDNIARPHEFEYVGDPEKRQDADVKARKTKLENIFDYCNEKHSFWTVRQKVEMDYWATGNGFFEILRDRDTWKPQWYYHSPATWMRITNLDMSGDDQAGGHILVNYQIPRNGKLQEFPVWKRFRRFARAIPGDRVRWFKEFGDPRVVNCETGEYFKNPDGSWLLQRELDPDNDAHKEAWRKQANEIWWWRSVIGGSPYGMPIWTASMADVRGAYLSSWVSYDTLDHGGVPPWLLLIYGRLSDESKKYLQQVIESWRDPNAWSDPCVLQIEPNILSFNSQGGSKAGAEFVSMRDMRAEDSMFSRYRDETRKAVMAVFRLAGVMLGFSEGAGGTNYAALETVENQVFAPLRIAEDERINVELIQGEYDIYDWCFRTKPCPIGDKEQQYKAIGTVGRTGGATLNDMTIAKNDIFGMQSPTKDHPFYSELDAVLATAMVRQGLVTFELSEDGKHYTPKIMPPGSNVPGNPELLDSNLPAPESPSAPNGQAQKSDSNNEDKEALSDAQMLLEAMKRINKHVQAYEPKEITEEDMRI